MRTARSRAIIPAVVATLGVGVALAAGLYQRRLNRHGAEARLEQLADRATAQTRSRMVLYAYGARGARGAVVGAGDERISRDAFARYGLSRDLAEEFPGALGYGFVRRVRETDESAFVAAARRDGWPTFTVRQLTPHPGERFLLHYMEPVDQASSLIGLDFASLPETKTAALEAMLSGEATATGPLDLARVGYPSALGVVLFLPIFRGAEMPTTASARQAATIGWSCATIALADVVAELQAQASDYTLVLTDVTLSDADGAPFASTKAAGEATELVAHRSMRLLGRTWRLDVTATTDIYADLHQPDPRAVGATVTLCAGVAALLIYLRGRRLERHEAQVSATEKRFRDLAESLPHMVWTCASDGTCDYLSPQWVAYTGVPEPEQLGYGWLAQLHPDDLESTKQRWLEAAAAGRPFDMEFRIRRFDGVYRVFKTRAVGVRDHAGKLVRWFGSNTDVQDLRDAQDALLALNRELEARIDARTMELQATNSRLQTASAQLKAAQRITEVGSWELDVASGEVLWSDELFNIFRLPVQAHAPHYSTQEGLFAPESWTRLTKAVANSVATGEGYELTLAIVRSDGEARTSVARAEALRGAEGTVEKLVGTFQDTTEREQAASRIRSVTERLQLATSAAKMGVWDWNVATNALVWDQAMHDLYETTDSGAGVYDLWRNALHPDDRAAAETALTDAVNGSKEFDTTFRIACPSGRVKHIKATALAHRDASGRVLRMVGLNWDVSDKVEAESSLRKSEGMQRAILSYAGSAIIATDCDGVIASFNLAAEGLLGYPAKDLVGKATPALFHDPAEVETRRVALEKELGISIDRPFDVFVAKAKRGVTDAREWTYVRRDGSRVPVLLTVTSIRDEANAITGFLGVAVDLTQSKQQEGELRELNRQLANQSAQRETLLQEVHHRVKNNLQVIASLIRLQIRQIGDRAAKNALVEAQSRVASIALIHERLYQSQDYSRVPFSEYATSLARNVFDAAGASPSRVGLELDIEPLNLPVDRAIPCGLILNELITNALKHAFPEGRVGKVTVHMHRRSHGEVMLSVADDGVGLPDRLGERAKKSLGMQLITTLVEQINGRVDFFGGNGTTCQIRFSQSEVS